MHLRKWPQLTAPCRIVQIVRIHDLDDGRLEQTVVDALPPGAAYDLRQRRHLVGNFANGNSLTWERHSEASTATIFMSGDFDSPVRTGADGTSGPKLSWLVRLPGKVIRATEVIVVESESLANQILPQFQFASGELVSCHIGQSSVSQGARIWSDFRIHENSFGVVLVAANGLRQIELSTAIKQLQELGNYRNLALLGLPVAQHGWREMSKIEAQLNALASQIGDSGLRDDDLFRSISEIAADLLSRAVEDDFRIDATHAYGKIVTDRLAGLNVRRCDEYLSLTEFTERRFLPAMRTCEAHRRRSKKISRRAEQFINLFRSRIETRIENQNSAQLKSMDQSAKRQLRLHQPVEGLSVFALTYYATGLLDHKLRGLEKFDERFNAVAVSAITTPLTFVLILLAMRLAKAEHFPE